MLTLNSYSYYICYILSIISQLILFFLGWSPLNWTRIRSIKKCKRAILIFSHTSYWDFWLIILYRLAYPAFLKNIYTVMKPQPFTKFYGKWLTYFNFIPASKL